MNLLEMRSLLLGVQGPAAFSRVSSLGIVIVGPAFLVLGGEHGAPNGFGLSRG